MEELQAYQPWMSVSLKVIIELLQATDVALHANWLMVHIIS